MSYWSRLDVAPGAAEPSGVTGPTEGRTPSGGQQRGMVESEGFDGDDMVILRLFLGDL